MPTFTSALMRNFSIHFGNLCNIFTVNTKYGAIAATATPILIFAGIYIAWAYAERAWKCKNKFDCVYKRSMSMGALHGGKLALERLMDYNHARADAASLDAAELELKSLLAEEYPDFNKLQSTIAKLEMSGKEAIAVGILETELQKAQNERKSHEAYEIGMLLVEMQIYKGDFTKAIGRECLRHEEITDARRPLFKAIIYILLDESEKEASKFWEEFKEIRTHFQYPPSAEHSELAKVISNFHEFKKIVKSLKNDIHEAHIQRTKK